MEHGGARKGGRCFDKLKKLYEQIRAEDHMEDLTVLLRDKDGGVRFEAAVKLCYISGEGEKGTCLHSAPKRWSAGCGGMDTEMVG